MKTLTGCAMTVCIVCVCVMCEDVCVCMHVSFQSPHTGGHTHAHTHTRTHTLCIQCYYYFLVPD